MSKEDDVLRTVANLDRYEQSYHAGGRARDVRDFKSYAVFEHWMVVENEFPYDKIAAVHRLLAPKRSMSEPFEMNAEEVRELHGIMQAWAEAKEYDTMMLNFHHSRTLPKQLHFHLVRFINVTPIHA